MQYILNADWINARLYPMQLVQLSFVQTQMAIHLNGLLYLWEMQEKATRTLHFQMHGGGIKNEWQPYEPAKKQCDLPAGVGMLAIYTHPRTCIYVNLA